MPTNKKDRGLSDKKPAQVIQSNRVTFAKIDYSLLQHRVFTYIMFNLQYEIEQVMKGLSVQQLDMFKAPTDMFAMQIPLHQLGRPDQYRDIRDAIFKMSKQQIIINTVNKDRLRWGGIFSSVEMPTEDSNTRSAVVTIEIRRDVAETLVDLHYKNGSAEQYTIFTLQVALNAKTKYSIMLYKILCSYRSKRQYFCTIDELRTHLNLQPNEYTNFKDLKRRILDPVAAELKATADLFYDTSDSDFILRTGRKVMSLRFTIQFPLTDQLYERNKANYIRDLIRIFGCKPIHINQVLPYLTMDVNWNKLQDVFNRCAYLCNKRMVDHPAAFITKSIIKEFDPVSS